MELASRRAAGERRGPRVRGQSLNITSVSLEHRNPSIFAVEDTHACPTIGGGGEKRVGVGTGNRVNDGGRRVQGGTREGRVEEREG